MQLNLTTAEALLLGEMLTHYLEDLRREIAATDDKEFRLKLRERESLLERLVNDLGAGWDATAKAR